VTRSGVPAGSGAAGSGAADAHSTGASNATVNGIANRNRYRRLAHIASPDHRIMTGRRRRAHQIPAATARDDVMGASAPIEPETVDGLFRRAASTDPTRPLLTWYDDATGERVELSGATLDNWVAKTANLVVDGCGLGTGDRAAALLPPHWQTAAVLLGCWTAGLSMATPADGSGPDGSGTGPAGSVDVLFVAAATATDDPSAVPAAGERFALGLAPLGAPLREVPAGFVDYVAEVRGHGDRFTPYRKVTPGDAGLHGPGALTHGELCATATRRAEALGIGPGARVLIDAAAHPDPLDWLLAPLAAGATTVLCGNLDPARAADRAASERVTVRLTAGRE
jgi:uncharacterized protein (TIGR03089 family)